jgi:hypothetical protein
VSVIPGRLLTEAVIAEPYQGISSSGPAFGPPITVRAQIQETAGLPQRKASSTSTAPLPATRTITYQVWVRPGPTLPVGSRVTVRGVRCTASAVAVNTAPRLPVPAHIQLTCERTDFLPSTTVTILRGSPSADAFGDDVDTPTAVASGIEALIIEDSQTSNELVDERGGIVETYTVRLRYDADTREGDRIRDDLTSRIYRVLDVRRANPALGPEMGSDDLVATCRRVAATSTP